MSASVQPDSAQYSPVQPNFAHHSSVHSSSRVLKWPNLFSKRPVKVRRWQIYHYYCFDCTELHLLSIDSIAASLFENIWLPHSSQYQRKCVGASTYIKGENY